MTASLIVGHDVESSFLWAAIGEKAKYCKIKSGWNEEYGAICDSPTVSEDRQELSVVPHMPVYYAESFCRAN